MNPAVSIIVPCRNERGHIEELVRSLLRQEAVPGGFEVIVSDGLSDDGTRDVLLQLSQNDDRVRIIDNPALIVSAGLNTAVRQSRGAIILRMDAHTRYESDYVLRCVETLSRRGADNVGGPWVAVGRGMVGQAIAAAFESPFSFGGTRGHNRVYNGPADTVYLGCWRRDVFDRIGLFDEELVRNQDDEFNLRLIRAGGRVWQSSSIKCFYAARESLTGLFRQYLQYGYWKVRVIQKHSMPASLRHLVPAVFVTALLLLALGSMISANAARALSVLVGTYVVFVFVGSALAAGGRWRLLPLLPITFACYHFAYGLGFLHGVVDFVLLRRRTSKNHQSLTRPTARRSVHAGDWP